MKRLRKLHRPWRSISLPYDPAFPPDDQPHLLRPSLPMARRGRRRKRLGKTYQVGFGRIFPKRRAPRLTMKWTRFPLRSWSEPGVQIWYARKQCGFIGPAGLGGCTV